MALVTRDTHNVSLPGGAGGVAVQGDGPALGGERVAAAGLVHDVRGNWKQAASVGCSNFNFFQNWRTLCMSKFG